MGDRRCCCTTGCWSFLDYFYRDDSTDLGSKWHELHGDWQIKSFQLYEPGDPASLLHGTEPQPVISKGDQYVEITANNFVADQQVTLYSHVTIVADSFTSYWKATYRKMNSSAGGDWEVKLYKNTTLIATKEMTPFPFYHDYEIMDYTSTDFVRCWLCVDEAGNPRAGVYSGDEPCWSIEEGGLDGRYYGVGHTNSIETYLNDFGVYELHDATHACRDCWCPCCNNQLSPVLNATIVVDPDTSPNRAACLEGDNTELVYQWEGGLQHREGTITHVRGAYTSTWALILACDSTADTNCTGQNITLNVTSNCARLDDPLSGTLCTGGGCTLRPLPTSTCEPLNLIFGPFYYGDTMLACAACYDPAIPMPPYTNPRVGKYYIVITEASGIALWENGDLQQWEDGTLRNWES